MMDSNVARTLGCKWFPAHDVVAIGPPSLAVDSLLQPVHCNQRAKTRLLYFQCFTKEPAYCIAPKPGIAGQAGAAGLNCCR
jgi:hypothetical protein